MVLFLRYLAFGVIIYSSPKFGFNHLLKFLFACFNGYMLCRLVGDCAPSVNLEAGTPISYFPLFVTLMAPLPNASWDWVRVKRHLIVLWLQDPELIRSYLQNCFQRADSRFYQSYAQILSLQLKDTQGTFGGITKRICMLYWILFSVSSVQPQFCKLKDKLALHVL